ncbi:MAG: tRNA 2-thiocytidine biosynthesis TtcA family protein [Anaeromicrobium sp.]|jgi:tRNA(Ile)-lysidine synthase TilS/MesJ|uniref:tRNA 2-thiocytidine biosynthesis TtcA family protein n=1 Tax=Anaeromicrobium sp. TaxID=1929132 RepID=UPI0025F7FE8A|nr:tRNA 2-thiocytidine biosynthesis TtcA family protein [Anaeromicrobium sp.]MCT4595403.1 tRNA 2-thiocytidine biosynthesis TtcA family protein [Anaeromicrobium sp.]
MKKIVGCVKRAVEEFNMIEDGDVVGVGISGGKDSSALLYALRLYQNFSKAKFKIKALTLTLGFEGFDISPLTKFCNELGIEHVVVPTQIGKVIFEERKEKNPCSLCARMRRGRLHNLCKELGVTKLALGHHGDDAIETLFLSMFYEGRLNTFEPVTYLDRKDLTMIRPLMYAYEKDIILAVKRHDIPVVESPCPADKKTKREYAKRLISSIEKDIPNVRGNILRALENKDQMYLWFKK